MSLSLDLEPCNRQERGGKVRQDKCCKGGQIEEGVQRGRTKEVKLVRIKEAKKGRGGGRFLSVLRPHIKHIFIHLEQTCVSLCLSLHSQSQHTITP